MGFQRKEEVTLKSKFLEDQIHYDGSQLRTHFAYDHGVDGNSIIGFLGGANVSDHMVDKEDLKHKDFIFSEKMLHFIVTFFNEDDTEKIVMFQRMIMRIIKDILNDVSSNKYKTTNDLRYELFGDDIKKSRTGEKLSVSIATKSLFAGLVHVGLNINAVEKGKVKVETCGLSDLSENFTKTKYVEELFNDISEKFTKEFISVKKASYKVIAVD
jgi:hypothetical protein